MAPLPNLVDALSALDIQPGDLLIVHASFKALQWSEVSPQQILDALLHRLGPDGTLMMPAFTYSYAGILNVEAFDSDSTPGSGNGVLSETLRKQPTAYRSGHPTHSVVAIGVMAQALTENFDRTSALGLDSSFAAAYQSHAKICLLGVGNDRNSMVHYAEAAAQVSYQDIPCRAFWGRTALIRGPDGPEEIALSAPYPGCSSEFRVLDKHMIDRNLVTLGTVGAAPTMIMHSKDLVEEVVKKLNTEPGWLLCRSIACEPCNLRRRKLEADKSGSIQP